MPEPVARSPITPQLAGRRHRKLEGEPLPGTRTGRARVLLATARPGYARLERLAFELARLPG